MIKPDAVIQILRKVDKVILFCLAFYFEGCMIHGHWLTSDIDSKGCILMGKNDTKSGLNIYKQSFMSKDKIFHNHSKILMQSCNFKRTVRLYQCFWEDLKSGKISTSEFFSEWDLPLLPIPNINAKDFMIKYYTGRHDLKLLTPRLAMKAAFNNFGSIHYSDNDSSHKLYHLGMYSKFYILLIIN